MSLEAEQQLFEACLAAASAEERERLLTTHPDPELAGRVRRLLEVHDSHSRSLVTPRAMAPGPERIGPYTIRERIGEGAMGEVFLAEQFEPVRRRVGLKIIKFGVGTREVTARFELERQTLALMTHPNVARILDAGTTPDGRPYFAMEYVPGIPITRYCDERRLDLDARLALFAGVCAGVQHAHLRGVIHRDLKPTNILVAEVDGRAVPKIIDFGIAKATTATARDGDAFTRIGHVLGTPEYMSPEQAQLSPLDVDARTDVYSLGVLLFELLTGTRPYSVTRDSLDPAVIAREIVESEPVRPSHRAADGTPEAQQRAAARSTTTARLVARLRGDLDWIVLKALEKDRQRRYASPAELAADLARAAHDEPVTAGPPSAGYVLGKFVRRHRFVVVSASVAFVSAIAFGTAMAMLAQRAAAERDRANDEAEVARRVTEFTAGLFEGANPERSLRRDATARELVDAGVRRLESTARQERADVRAALYEAAANAYRGLGDYALAAPLMDQAVGLRATARTTAPVAYATALRSRAALEGSRGDFGAAERSLRESLSVLVAVEPPATATARRTRLELAAALVRTNRLDEAAALASEVLLEYAREPTDDVLGHAAATAMLGRVELERGRVDAAIPRIARALDMYRAAYGDTFVGTLEAKTSLAFAYVTKGDATRAEPLLREVVEDARRVYGPEHLEVGVALTNLGNAVSDFESRFDEAERIYEDAVAILRKSGGANHPQLATGLGNLCSLYLREKRWEPARAACAEAREIRTRTLGPLHAETAGSQVGEALALNKLDDYAGAEALLRAAITTFTTALGAEHWRVANARTYLGIVLGNLKRYDEAEQELVAARSTLEHTLGPDNRRTQSAEEALHELRAKRARAATAGQRLAASRAGGGSVSVPAR